MAATAGVRPREGTPPPIIGKAGRYTVFITPPATPKTPSQSPRPQGPQVSPTPTTTPTATPRPSLTPTPTPSPKIAAAPTPAKAAPPSPAPPPVQVPPPQFDKAGSQSSNSSFGFFWDAVAKVQNAHSRLDECIADWFGLNQSKYQWALNDYYENKGMVRSAPMGSGRPSFIFFFFSLAMATTIS